jgi:hypothetical protein
MGYDCQQDRQEHHSSPEPRRPELGSGHIVDISLLPLLYSLPLLASNDNVWQVRVTNLFCTFSANITFYNTAETDTDGNDVSLHLV